MVRNISEIDKWARICIGLGIVGLGLYYNSLLGLLGLIFIVVGLANWCPLYAIFNYSTYKKTPAKTITSKKAKPKKKKK